MNTSHSKLLTAIHNHAINNPDKIALIEGEMVISYSILWSEVCLTANYLQEIGLNCGDKIILAAKKEKEFIYVYLASHLIGVVNVVVDIASTTDRIDYIANLVKPKCIFGISYSTKDCLSLKYDEIKNYNGSLDLPVIESSSTADVMFTTGTTGNPKGVCLSYGNIDGSVANINAFIGNTSEDVEVLGLPLSHSFGLGRVRCVLTKGGTIILLGNFANLKVFFNIIEKYHVTGFGMVPAVWQYIRRFSGNRIGRYSQQIRYIEIGSAAMPIEDKRLLVELFPETRICMHYGLTEASRAFFMEFHTFKDNLESIGFPASNLVEAKILDDEGNELPIGEDGEICVRGNMVAQSYYLPNDNVEAFHGAYFRTGDWGHQDEKGLFYLVGRSKELINIGGEKISPSEIEEAILCLGVEDCACISMPDPNGILGEVPKAFIVKGKLDLTIDHIKEGLSKILASHFIPQEFVWVNQIPRTSSGKIQRLLLK